MKTFLKICLVVLIILALAGADLWVVLKLGWPLWVGGAIFAGILGVAIGILFVRKYLLRRRERKFVHRVVQLDEAAIGSTPLRQRKDLEDLQDKWREAVTLLKKSQLRKRGNPLYALPWFLIIGESGSGKTTALKNARLDAPLHYPGQTSNIASTRNCDWWFFDEAIVLDTAGRYTIPVDEVPDREEWEEFLILLAKYRKREPVNGVIVTVPADKLLAADRERLRMDGQNIRKRIDQIMRVVGARFPIYVFVTKMDKVYGFSDTFLSLPEEETDQAFGYLNSSPKMHWEEVLDLTFRHIADQLRSARFTFLHKVNGAGPGVVLFPEEFDRLKEGLSEFLRDVCVDNPYQESPFLRGVYFSSGLQEGTAQSRILDLAEHGREKNGGAAPSRGLFLKDLFARVLPGDRSLYTRAYEFLRWQRWTRSLGFTSWILIWLALCGLLTYSFAVNYRTLSTFTARFSKAPVLQHSIVVDLLMLEKFRLDLEDMDKANHRWFVPRFGLTASLHAEKMGKDLYADLFRRGFERPFDKSFYTQLSKVDSTTDPAIMAEYAGYIVARADTLQDYLKHGKVTESTDYSRTTADLMKTLYPTVVRSDAFYTVGNMYAAYLDWTADKAAAQRGVELLASSLNSLLRKNGSLDWLVKEPVALTPAVKLEDFWERSYVASSDSSISVPGAYTKAGRKTIEAFIKDLQMVSPQSAMLKDNAKAFWTWYETQYYEAWSNFAREFAKGAEVYTSAQERQKMATIMTTDHNPYWKLLDRMAAEIPSAATSGRSVTPSWAALVVEISEMRKLLVQEAPKDQKQTLKEKMAAEAHKVEKEVKKAEEKVAPLDARQQEVLAKRPTAAKSFGEYKKSLGEIAPVATSQETGFQMVTDLFTGQADFSKSKSPYNQAFLNIMTTKNVMKGEFGGDIDFVWALVIGPLQYLIQYGLDRTAASLQAQWEGDVLGQLEGVSKENLTKTLFDKKDGLALKFRDGPAKPFLVSGKWGYTPSKAYEKTAYETSVPFRSEFLQFLNAKRVTQVAERLPSYSVPLETVPIAVNSETVVKPLGNVVTLQCADGDIVLYNYNYPDSRTFNWAPEKCGTTSVKIIFPDNLMLYKSYSGAAGFPHFLKDFETGTHTFKPEDFPDKKAALSRNNVKWIKVTYKIQNGVPVINTLKKPAGVQVPSLITTYSPRGS